MGSGPLILEKNLASHYMSGPTDILSDKVRDFVHQIWATNFILKAVLLILLGNDHSDWIHHITDSKQGAIK